jgi:hypothetical protein
MFSTVTKSLLQVYNTFADPVAVRSKASVCGGSLAGKAGSNPARDMDMHLL